MDIAQGCSVDDQVARAKAKLLAVGEEPFDPPLWPLAAALAAGGALGCFARAGGKRAPINTAPAEPTSSLVELAVRLAVDLLGSKRSGRAEGPG